MFLPAEFSFLTNVWVFFSFSSAVLRLGVVSGPSLFGGHTPSPPFPDPSSGPLALAQLTSTSCLRAKPSPRQLQPDWQGSGAGRRPRGAQCGRSLARAGSRLCGEPDKESRAGALCRRWEPRKDEVGAEEGTCPPWAGGAAGRPGPCTRQCAWAAPPLPSCWPGAGWCCEVW